MAHGAHRIDETFGRLRQERSGALWPFFTAGYPNIRATEEMLVRAAQAGVAGAEIGFPYSDSIADGPTIASSFGEALRCGVTVSDVFEMAASVRARTEMPLLAMVSFSIVERIGIEAFVNRAAGSGFDGLIVPDLPLEEAPRIRDVARGAQLSLIMLVAPTSSPDRRKAICEVCEGFVYYVSVAGLTGGRDGVASDLAGNVRELRGHTNLPICVGFGLSSPEHVASVCSVADGAIVGSALMRKIGSGLEAGTPEDRIIDSVGEFLDTLQSATRKSGVAETGPAAPPEPRP